MRRCRARSRRSAIRFFDSLAAQLGRWAASDISHRSHAWLTPSYRRHGRLFRILRDDVIELRLIRVLGPADVDRRPPEAQFLAPATECRFAIHRREDGVRVGRVHVRLTDESTIVRALGHSGYEVEEAYRRRGYATRALLAIRRVARHYRIAPLWVLIAPGNVASRRTAERAGLTLVDTIVTVPEALAMGLEPELCRYVVVQP